MESTTQLPLPVARLLRRSRNDKSPKGRHDQAFMAWETSVHIAVAWRGMRANLAKASFGDWTRALGGSDRSVTAPELLALHALANELVQGVRREVASTRVSELFAGLAAYRNRAIGHTGSFQDEFYSRACELLRAGCARAWSEGLFLPPEAWLAYSDAVELAPDGRRLARVFELTGESPALLDPLGTAVDAEFLPGRVLVRLGEEWRSLHPWIVYDSAEETAYAFAAAKHRVEFLDQASGDVLDPVRLERIAPRAEAEVRAFFGAPAPAEEAPITTGERRVGGFTLLELLGQGGMGIVHLARQESLGRLVALKLLPESARGNAVAAARFRREIAALARCEHPNVVKILASGEHDGLPYFAMEYVQGIDLRRVGEELSSTHDFERAVSSAWEGRRSALVSSPVSNEPVRLTETGDRYRAAARFLAEAARGVAHLHAHGVIHRDLSPANLMVTVPEGRAVVMDLGLAYLREPAVSLTRDKAQLLGTLRYMAPEQLRRDLIELGPRVDVYALGAVLYELLCDRPMHDGDSEERLVQQVLFGEPAHARELDRKIPEDLALIVETATRRDPAERFSSADELADDLELFLAGRPIRARAPTAAYLFRKWVRRNPALAATSAAAVIAIAAAGARHVGAVANERDQARLVADLRGPESLRARAELLWPAVPEQVPAMDAWIVEARDLLARRAEVLAGLQRSDERAAGHDVQAANSVGGQAGASRRFATEVEALGAGPEQSNSIAEVEARRAFAARLARVTLEEPAAAWQAAIAAVRASPRYGGLEITPQLGLVPLGLDPLSGLMEFAHVATGVVPRRTVNGALELDVGSALVLVLLPGGRFWMGDRDAVGPRAADDPAHEVELAPFFLGKHEVTQAQWKRLTHETPSYCEAGKKTECEIHLDASHPVESLSWRSACLWLGRVGLELPTEAQWEYSARATTTSIWATGDEPGSLFGHANLADKSAERCAARETVGPYIEFDDGFDLTAPVGSFIANEFGLHDMLGNVMEWCRDGHVYYRQAAPRRGDGLRADAPRLLRVVRGGAYDGNADYLRSAGRIAVSSASELPSLGLRAARRVDP